MRYQPYTQLARCLAVLISLRAATPPVQAQVTPMRGAVRASAGQPVASTSYAVAGTSSSRKCSKRGGYPGAPRPRRLTCRASAVRGWAAQAAGLCDQQLPDLAIAPSCLLAPPAVAAPHNLRRPTHRPTTARPPPPPLPPPPAFCCRAWRRRLRRQPPRPRTWDLLRAPTSPFCTRTLTGGRWCTWTTRRPLTSRGR